MGSSLKRMATDIAMMYVSMDICQCLLIGMVPKHKRNHSVEFIRIERIVEDQRIQPQAKYFNSRIF
jgi:hypothetical protein